MRVEKPLSPNQFEKLAIRYVLPDTIAIFLFFLIIVSAVIIYFNIIKFPDILLLMPATVFLCILIAVLRFRTYLFTTTRVMGALSYIYNELGKGESIITMRFKKMFVILGKIPGAIKEEHAEKGHFYTMKTNSQRYKSVIMCNVKKGKYVLGITLADWKGGLYTDKTKGKISNLQKDAKKLLAKIKEEVVQQNV